MLSSAQQMLQESRSKIESLRLQILKAAQSGETEEGNLSPLTDVSRRTELQHYIQRESDALALATDIASSLQDLKNMEPSASTEALVRVCDTTRRLELLKTSLDRCQEEPRDHVPSLPPSTEHASLSSSPSTLLTKPACLTDDRLRQLNRMPIPRYHNKRQAMAQRKKKYNCWQRYMQTGNYIDYVRAARYRSNLINSTRKLCRELKHDISRNINTDPKAFW
ncbi:unnamed protein product [Boreogadus saida]